MLNEDGKLRHILIFRDKGKPGMGVAAKLRKPTRNGNFLAVTTADIASLRQTLEEQPISAVVIDIGREIGATLAALRVLKGFPAIPLFIFNGFLLPQIEEKAKEYEQVHYFENHDALSDGISLILAASDGNNRGSSHSISLLQFMQLLNLEKWSGRIMVAAGTNHGILLFRRGGLIDAAADALTGRAAWEQMATWENISVETYADILPGKTRGVRLSPMASPLKKTNTSQSSKSAGQTSVGSIESLHLVRQDRKLVLNLKKLNLGVTEIREALSAKLMLTDIFLSHNSRSLAGWNSSPLACSSFAAITKSLKNALQLSRFPALGAYYLLDLDDDQLVFIVVHEELQWGFLLQGVKDRLGLLLNIVLPKALKTLDGSIAVECSL